MSDFITLQEAIKREIVHVGDYFLTEEPEDRCIILKKHQTGYNAEQVFIVKAGERKLWRLEEGLELWGELTKESLTLEGQTGFISGAITMNRLAYKLNSLPGIFYRIQACSFPQNKYEFLNVPNVIQEEKNNYSKLDDRELDYWIASSYKEVYGKNTYFRMFAVNNGCLSSYTLFCSYGMSQSWSLPIRPKAIPNPDLHLKTKWRDGSKEKPWECLVE